MKTIIGFILLAFSCYGQGQGSTRFTSLCSATVTKNCIPAADASGNFNPPGNVVVGTTVGGVRSGRSTVPQAGSAWAAPYDVILTGAGNWGMGSTSFETVFAAYQYRVRQSGTVTAIKIYTPTGAKSKLVTMKLRIWRNLDATSVLVGESNDFSSALTEGQTTKVTFTTPITGVQQGDYYGYRQTLSGGTSLFAATSAMADGKGYLDADDPPFTSGVNVASLTAYNFLVPISLYMDPPTAIYIGDSNTQGVPDNYAFSQNADGTTFDLTTYWGEWVAGNFGWTYQNMGHGSDTTAQMLARFDADVVAQSPRYVTIMGGTNDLLVDTSASAITANLTAMYAKAFNAGITPIIIPILPCMSCTTTQMRIRDAVNAAIIDAAPTYGGIVAFGANDAVAQFRADGDPGNLWDYHTGWNAGNWHMNATGSAAFGAAVIAAISPAVAAGTDAARMTPTGITTSGGYAGLQACWKPGGKTLGYGTAAEIAAGVCH